MSETEKRATPGYLEICAISLITTLITIFCYDFFYTEKIRTVDLKGYIESQNRLLAKGGISQTEWKKRLDTVDKILQTTAVNHPQEIVIIKDVVLHGGREIKIAH